MCFLLLVATLILPKVAYDPELLDEFCRIESIDKKERQIKILIEDYEEYHFNNYQDFEHPIILRYYDEEDYTY